MRKNLSFPQICVQAVHASIKATKNIPYKDEHPNIIVCGAKDEKELMKAKAWIESNNIKVFAFQEPDINNEYTALATEPIEENNKKIFKRFQLLK